MIDEKAFEVDSSYIEESSLDGKMYGMDLNLRARDGADLEYHLSRQAIKAYPMVIFWVFLVSICVIMEGYDTILIGNFYAYPTSAAKYGLGNASGAGAFFDVLLNGYLVDRFEHKRVRLGSLLVLTAFIIITFFAPNIRVLTGGAVLCGLPWGFFAIIAPAYASEVLYLFLSIYRSSYTNMCFIVGQQTAAGALDRLVHLTSEWSHIIPFLFNRCSPPSCSTSCGS